MKVLFICPKLTDGGAERVCANIANGLRQRGHEISILTNLNVPITYDVDRGIVLYPKKVAYRRFPSIKEFSNVFHVIKVIRPDVIVSILYDSATFAKIASVLICRCPVVASDHNVMERPTYAKFHYRQYLDKFIVNKYLDYLTVLTKADFKCIKGRIKNVCVMHNPLELEPVREIPPKEKIVLAVGRLDYWQVKGFDILIKAWSEIVKNHSEWELHIVGSGSEQAMCYLKKISSDMNNIQFVPYKKEIIEEYRKAEIFVLSSRYEGWGLVLLEAMSQGCACVACDYKGRQTEIVKNEYNGLICKVDDPQELAIKVESLICDKEKRAYYQKNAIVSLDKYSIVRISEQWENLLIHIIKEKRKQRFFSL